MPGELVPIIIINTNSTKEQEADYTATISRYDSGIIVLKDRIIYKNQMLSQSMEYIYKDIANAYSINEFSKEDVLTFINSINNVALYGSLFFVITIYMFILYFTSTLIDVIILGVLGFVFSRIVGIKIRYKATFNMGAYALTLPILLNLIYIVVNLFTGFEIKYFQWMYTTISYIYMIVAILMIKTDLINRQAELMKIIEEQEKVKQEIEEQERKKKEQEKEPENEDESDKKDKEKKKKEKDDGVGDSGLAPQE